MQWQNIIISIATLLASFYPASGQKPAEKLNDATKRSEEAVEILSSASQVLPKRVIDEAVGLGAFRCNKTDLLLEHAIICPGIIASRSRAGWSLPGFYRFVAGGFGRPDRAMGNADSVILVFIGKEPVDWPQILKNARSATAGSIESIRQDEAGAPNNMRVYAYVRRNRTWSGETLKSNLWKSVGLSEDNKINKRLYGLKGYQVLAGETNYSKSFPDSILDLRQFLNREWVADKQPQR